MSLFRANELFENEMKAIKEREEKIRLIEAEEKENADKSAKKDVAKDAKTSTKPKTVSDHFARLDDKQLAKAMKQVLAFAKKDLSLDIKYLTEMSRTNGPTLTAFVDKKPRNLETGTWVDKVITNFTVKITIKHDPKTNEFETAKIDVFYGNNTVNIAKLKFTGGSLQTDTNKAEEKPEKAK